MTEWLVSLQNAVADRYRIERELGQGGMATVYLAQDLKHDRKVAIKVLRPELAAVIGAERFLREIKTIATLQHPHILGLIDSGEANGTAYYVMPYVEGESLRDRLARETQLPIAEAIRIATEVASALDYAHRHGVIHRDIKPENVLLHDGSALVADFGIALAVSSVGSNRMTETGMSLGTPHYMSPEQAMGEREITARADVYALGCVTYEMLTGDPPFTGSTAQAILAKVITEKPASLQKQRERVPDEVEDAVLTALEKLPADRFATAAQFAEALRGAPGSPASRRAPARGGNARASASAWSARARDPVMLALVAIALAAIAIAASRWRGAPGAPAEVVRFTLPAALNGHANSVGENIVAVSPDGRSLVYVGMAAGGHEQLVLRTLDNLDARPLPGTEDAIHPTFSPDGRWVAFVHGNQLYKIAVDGAQPQLLSTTRALGVFSGASWSTSGVIVISNGAALFALPDAGGSARALGRGAHPNFLYEFAPLVWDETKSVIYARWTGGSPATARIAIMPIGGGESTVLDLKGIAPLGVIDGTLVYVSNDGVIMGVRIDVAKRRLLGPPVPLVDHVALNIGDGLAYAALSSAGTLIYQSGTQRSRVVVVGKDGGSRTVLNDAEDYSFPRLSPDGRQLAISMGTADHRDVWLDELASGTRTRLTIDGLSNERPEWSPDGRRVLFRTDRGSRSAIWSRPVDMSTEAAPLVGSDRVDVFEGIFTPDSRFLIFQLDTLSGDIYYRAGTGDTTTRPIANNPDAVEVMPRPSPDGRWVAFVTNESGRQEVVVQPFPGPGGRVQVSADGGTEPVWSRDGRRLFYRGSGKLMVAEVRTAPSFGVIARDTMLTDTYAFATNPHANYDVLPDGAHFLFLEPDRSGEMVVVVNWGATLRARMAGASVP
jgi:Tol biopolymer transport system component/tRNA A-37 threonylcarbamoyl transferase component Bud32